jgi:CDP-diglyceride synthetase
MGGNIDVHDGDDRREDEPWDPGDPAPEVPRSPTERVRIIGAEPAGEATQVVPAVPRTVVPLDEPDPGAEPAVRLIDEPGSPNDPDRTVQPVLPGETAVPGYTEPATPAWLAPEEAPLDEVPATELPHWTEAPTGQVPAVLARDSEDAGGAAGITAPAWREEEGDWVAHEDEFEASMFGDEEVALGSLDETDRTDADRRPWEFDLPSSGAPAVPTGARASAAAAPTHDPDVTNEVPVIGSYAGRHVADGPSVADDETLLGTAPAASAPVPPAGTPEDEPDDLPGLQRSRPTGTTRVGRVRRGGLRADRVKAKRPDDIDALTDAPLAAEPPGASVTAVPGAGRRRGGLAGLAAADRSAGQVTDLPDGSVAPDHRVDDLPDDHGPPPARPRRSSVRRPPTDDEPDGPLGGGPPAPRRPREAPGGDHQGGDLRVRIGTGVIVAVVGLTAFALGTVTSLILSILVLTFAAGECFGVLRRAGYHPATLLGLVGSVSLMVAAYDKGPSAVPLVLVLIVAFTLLWYLFGIERGSAVAGTAATLLTIGWISLFGSYAALLLSPSAHPNREGVAVLLGAIIATVANDVGALVVGGWIGRHPLAPTISPNKTWEGFLGGAVFSVIVSAVVVGEIHPWTPAKAALLGLMVAVVAPIGDLCESLLKRDLRIKDMGTLLPGHGGVLDRVDALLFVLPATYYLVRALHIG